MDPELLRARLLKTFRLEMADHLQQLSNGLLALEKCEENQDQTETINLLFRSAHSLKGAARSVELADIEELCHRLEALFASCREKGGGLNAEELTDAFDMLKGLEEFQSQADSSQDSAVREQPEIQPDAKVGPPASSAVKEESKDQHPKNIANNAADAKQLEKTIRVDVSKFDMLFELAGEMHLLRSQGEVLFEKVKSFDPNSFRQAKATSPWGKHPNQQSDPAVQVLMARPDRGEARGRGEVGRWFQAFQREFSAFTRQLAGISRRFQNEIHQVRLLPFRDACFGLERVVRDVCRQSNKEAELQIVGGDITVDRAIIEALTAPLIHLVRNAVDHGIENAADRISSGKSPTGNVCVAAKRAGQSIVIQISDDGAGVDVGKLHHSGSVHDRDTGTMPLDSIFEPGITSSNTVTEISGRGVGLDVVRNAISTLAGSVSVSSTPGKGTVFELTLPASLSFIKSVVTMVSGTRYAFASDYVEKVVSIRDSQLFIQDGKQRCQIGDRSYPVYHFLDAFNQKPKSDFSGSGVGMLTRGPGGSRLVLVDALLGLQDLVSLPLPEVAKGIDHISGVSITGDGALILILNMDSLLVSLANLKGGRTVARTTPKIRDTRKRVLLAEDSPTTRALGVSILSAAGFVVVPAENGEQAWELFEGNDFDIVVSDIDMPKMSGLALTRHIRKSSTKAEVPIVLLSSKDRDQDVSVGLQAGADRYLKKSSFDQTELVEVVEELTST